jgi:hypothetical protein
MENSHQYRLKNRIKESIKKFRNMEIGYNDLLASIAWNISALDVISNDLENAKRRLCPELETIFYMEDPINVHCKMLEEVEQFEKYIDHKL